MFRLVTVMLLATMAGCGGSTLPMGEAVLDGRTGAEAGFDAMVDDLLEARVIYVGEQHDQESHHAVQAAIATALHARDPSLAIGLEMVQRPFQHALDAYVAGEVDEEEMLRLAEWQERWGFDFAMYRPVFELARAHRLPIVALNAPRELTRAIGRGGLDALTAEQRATLPELDLDDAGHRAMVREALAGHADQMGEERLERLYTAQVTWDETMAETVADRLARPDAPRRMIVLAGDMHVRSGLGIPNRAARRGATPHRVVMTVSEGDEVPLDGSVADWVVVVDE